MLSPFLSQKFKFWSFVAMVLLVFVHGYNLEYRYLQPWTLPGEGLTFTSFFEYFLANGIFRFRIPMLFIISGYLFALHDQQPHGQRILKRVRTLLFPYLIWSALAIVTVYLLEVFPVTNQLVKSSQVVQIDENRFFIHEYKWYETLTRWIFFPVAYQLWFIRVLFIYNLAYLGIRWCVLGPKAKVVFFSFAVLLWLGTVGLPIIEGEGLLFFSLGVWIQKSDFNIEKPGPYFKPKFWGLVFLIMASLKTYLAFNGMPLLGEATETVLTLLHKLTIASGLIACWFGSDKVVSLFMKNPRLVWLSNFSFIIYALHAPLIAILINGMFHMLNFIPGYRIISFVLLPILIIAGCVGLGLLLRWISPKTFSLLTGGRGLTQL